MTQTAETTIGADASRPTRHVAFLSVVLAIGFVALIGVSLYFVVKSYRPTLFRDQWDELKFLFDIKNGTFPFSELFSQANEHRPFTARLFFMIDAFWFGFSNIFLLAMIFVSHLLLGGLIAFLWFDRSYDVRLRAAACIGGAATMVTIVQYENLTWGESIVWAHTYSFALLALLALGTAGLLVQNIRCWLLLGLYVVFYSLSSFTQANGLLVPGAAVVLIVFQRGRWLDVIVVVAAALIVSAFYMHGYYAPGLFPLAEQFTRAPSVLQYLLYLCHLLAAPWITDPTGRALLGGAGIGLLMLVTVAAIWDIRARRPMPLAPAVLTCLAGFTFVSATLISIGRASFGLWHAGESRYATPALVFWLSIAGVVYWLFIERLNLVRMAQARKIFAITLLAFLLAQVIRIDASDDTQRALSERILAIDRGSIALINNSYLTEGVGLENLYFPQAIKGRAAQLRAYGWSIFSPHQNTYAPPIHLLAGLPAKDIPICRGYVDAVTRLEVGEGGDKAWEGGGG